MGQSRSIVDQNIETYTDLLNMCVIIERSPSSKVSADAEGMYILPKNTNCVNITDLIFSLVKVPILLYISGQDVTHNYTPISMFYSHLEDDCLYFIYSDKYERPKDSAVIEEYIKECEIPYCKHIKIVFRAKKPFKGPVKKLQV